MIQSAVIKRKFSTHFCRQSIFIAPNDTQLECNSLIYVYDNGSYLFYEIISINEQNITCYSIGKYPVFFPQTPFLNWSSVGVFRKGGILKVQKTVQLSTVSGKLISVGEYLITCPMNVLREK